jgi:hypothetical protein
VPQVRVPPLDANLGLDLHCSTALLRLSSRAERPGSPTSAGPPLGGVGRAVEGRALFHAVPGFRGFETLEGSPRALYQDTNSPGSPADAAFASAGVRVVPTRFPFSS